MAIEELIDDFENMILSATRVVLTNKKVIDEDELITFIDQLRDIIPDEIKEARKIIETQNQMLAEAQANAESIKLAAKNSAEKIIASADKYAAEATDENRIISEAQRRASTMLEQAESEARKMGLAADEYAKNTRREAEEYSDNIRRDAQKYARDVLGYTKGKVAEILNTVEQAQKALDS
jgi:vacuolar-type H+-ATPase subunit H